MAACFRAVSGASRCSAFFSTHNSATGGQFQTIDRKEAAFRRLLLRDARIFQKRPCDGRLQGSPLALRLVKRAFPRRVPCMTTTVSAPPIRGIASMRFFGRLILLLS